MLNDVINLKNLKRFSSESSTFYDFKSETFFIIRLRNVDFGMLKLSYLFQTRYLTIRLSIKSLIFKYTITMSVDLVIPIKIKLLFN